MGQAITGQVQLNCSLQEIISSGVLNPVTYNLPINLKTQYVTAGTAAGQLDTVWASTGILAATTLPINLNSGLTDPAGNAIVFARVRLLVVVVTDTVSTHLLNVYASASDGFPWLPPVASKSTVYPNGGELILHDPQSTGSGNGMVVSPTTCDLTLNSNALNVGYSILIAGCTAV